MKLSGKSYVLLSSMLLGCNSLAIDSDYYDLGSFKTKIDAQNGALNNILKNYNSLPQNTYYKVRYKILNVSSNERSENAIWYNKKEEELALEADIRSGTICRWQEVNKIVLEEANKSSNGLLKIDSLAKPDQLFAQCK